MLRREMFGVVGAGVGLAALGAQADEPHSDHDGMIHRCLDACNKCMDQCNAMFHHCFELLKAGRTEHARSAQLSLDCAEFCNLSSTVMARKGPLMAEACATCAEACAACAAECEKFDSREMKECAAVCRSCEKVCREMTAHLKSAPRPTR